MELKEKSESKAQRESKAKVAHMSEVRWSTVSQHLPFGHPRSGRGSRNRVEFVSNLEQASVIATKTVSLKSFLVLLANRSQRQASTANYPTPHQTVHKALLAKRLQTLAPIDPAVRRMGWTTNSTTRAQGKAARYSRQDLWKGKKGTEACRRKDLADAIRCEGVT